MSKKKAKKKKGVKVTLTEDQLHELSEDGMTAEIHRYFDDLEQKGVQDISIDQIPTIFSDFLKKIR